ncbi:hypothetical protein [Moraxella catarrhalis]|uniref:Putative cytoplasmic protein n=1 Tax=Moraxella catarrhalis TaxID=480 RepID=A0A198UQP5_MORCA|nr:hypothetical protein [Moraxella catarrhalis]OAU97577.1 putative cytoplasmic protein [Moraxella catarrhalis]OAU98803.1 putative cytoplasmic protein [Moraxella catarrhalis]OAV02893.1 putative cytoplasmic protein [Moraxella catarrhalis]
MDNKVYLACYHGRADKVGHRLCDGITRFMTKGKYSHCEIVISKQDGLYECYSSSIRDGGVRVKTMKLDSSHWDLILLNISKEQVLDFYKQTANCSYDLLGALGIVLGLRQHPDKYFCSEWCFEAITNKQNGYRFSPNDLYAMKSILTRRH